MSEERIMPSELRRKKVDKTGECTDWEPIDLVQELLEEMKKGETKATHMLVLMWDEDEGSIHTNEWRAGITRAEEVAMLNLHLHQIIGRWRGTHE